MLCNRSIPGRNIFSLYFFTNTLIIFILWIYPYVKEEEIDLTIQSPESIQPSQPTNQLSQPTIQSGLQPSQAPQQSIQSTQPSQTVCPAQPMQPALRSTNQGNISLQLIGSIWNMGILSYMMIVVKLHNYFAVVVCMDIKLGRIFIGQSVNAVFSHTLF